VFLSLDSFRIHWNFTAQCQSKNNYSSLVGLKDFTPNWWRNPRARYLNPLVYSKLFLKSSCLRGLSKYTACLSLSSVSHWSNIKLFIGSKPNLIFSSADNSSEHLLRRTGASDKRLSWVLIVPRSSTERTAESRGGSRTFCYANPIKIISERSVYLLFCWISPFDSPDTSTGCNLHSTNTAKHFF
jgi:hypothetical protein